MRPLNLATHPFRNQTTPAVLFGLALAGLLAVTVVHAMAVARLLPGRSTALQTEVRQLEDEVARLQREEDQLRDQKVDAATVARWSQVKDLVDRRVFSWTDLFSRLEEALPRGVRLVSISPTVEEGEVVLDVLAVAETQQEGRDLIRILEERGDFHEVYPLSAASSSEGEALRYSVRFRPQVRPVQHASPAPADRSGGEEEADAQVEEEES